MRHRLGDHIAHDALLEDVVTEAIKTYLVYQPPLNRLVELAARLDEITQFVAPWAQPVEDLAVLLDEAAELRQLLALRLLGDALLEQGPEAVGER